MSLYERARGRLGPDGTVREGQSVTVRVAGKDLEVVRSDPAESLGPRRQTSFEAALGIPAPELIVEPAPAVKIADLGKPSFSMRGDLAGDTVTSRVPPEVAFREGVRKCLAAGVSKDKMLEIMDLETARSVMDS